MEGIVVHMVIGFALFIPLGFITAMYQYRKATEKEKELEHRKEMMDDEF